MIKKIKNRWEILIILLLGLTPLLWYKYPNSLALGHDMGFPIDPISFFNDRLFLWTDRVGLGWDQTLGSAALLIHGLEASLASFGLSIFIVQRLDFIFWFVLPGLAMYFFVSRFHKDKEQWFIRLSASLFYMFNHFLLQGWFIAERTKFSLYAALPLLLALLIQMIQGKISLLKGFALISLVFFFLNGGGGIPLYGGLLLALALAFVFFGYIQIRKNVIETKRLFLIGVGLLFSFVFVNFYWILPTFIKTFSSYGESLSSIGGISSVLAWSIEVSRFASLQNVVRLQGIPDWYDNPSHPYSKIFFENPILIIISILIPLIVFSSLILVRKLPQHRNNIFFFNVLAILGVIFTAGSHPPLGFFYNLLLSYVPGFAIFRSGFYKFAPALWFSYAYLFSFSLYFIVQKIKPIKKPYIKNSILLIVLFVILGYSFPFFTGGFFKWRVPFSTMTTLPSYVLDFSKWSNSNLTFNDRVLSFPEQNRGWNTAIYRWGYWSTASVESLFTDKSIISNDKVMSPFEKKLIEKIYASILNGKNEWEKPLNILGINYFLLHNDFFFDAPKMQTFSPGEYKKRFSEIDISKDKTFGLWDIYSVNSSVGKFFVDSSPDLIIGSNDILDNEFLDVNNVIKIPEISNFYFTDAINLKNNNIFSREIEIKNCLFCDKENRQFYLYAPEPKILPDSIIYPFLESKEEKQRKVFSNNINSQIDFSLGTSLKRIGEIKALVSKKKRDDDLRKTLNRLNTELDYVSSAVINLDKSSNSSQLTILRVNNFLAEEQRLIDEIGEQGDSNINALMIPVSAKIANIYQKNEKYQYNYPSDNEKIYFFNLNQDKEKELLIRNEEGDQKINISKVVIDKNNIDFKSEEKNGYTLLGKLKLKKGEHEIKITLSDSINLIEKGRYYVNGCHNFTINNTVPDKIYKLDFNFKGKDFITDSRSFVKIEQKTFDENLSSRIKFSDNASSNRFESKITTSNQTKSLDISICPPSGKAEDIRIDNVVFKLFQTPTAILASEAQKGKKSSPEISVNMINKTNYEISVSKAIKPFLLVMNDEFNQNWKISSKGYQINSDHIKVNGFANGWIVDKKGDYVLRVEYAPQKYFYLGLTVTSVYIVLVIAYLVINRKRKKNESN